MTGFDEGELSYIFGKALPLIQANSRAKYRNNEALMISLIYLRKGMTCTSLASILGDHSSNSIETAINKGLKALAKCFNPFELYDNKCSKQMKEYMKQSEVDIIQQRMENSERILKSRYSRL